MLFRSDQEDRAIGFMHLARPVPGPDTRFESLTQDPLLTGIPVGLCSAVEPASLIPLPIGGCLTTKDSKAGGLLVIPVSIWNTLHHLKQQLLSDVLVYRYLLLQPRSDAHCLRCRIVNSAAVSCAALRQRSLGD